MATGDFGWLKLQLAYMSGRNSVAELDNDADLAGQCVNEALLDVYMNPGGPRPGFALQSWGLSLRAPITGTVGVTQRSNLITGFSFPADVVGSTIQIGQSYYTYQGTIAGVATLVEPVKEATGSYGFTLWHDSYPLNSAIVEMEDGPLVLGWGMLRPMNSRVERLKWQQITYGDFWPPAPFGAGLLTTINWPGGLTYPVGTPLFYQMDNGPMGNTAFGNYIESGEVALNSGDNDATITFDNEFVDLPVVVATVYAPDGTGGVITATVDDDSLTVAGADLLLGGTVPGDGYKLAWAAQGNAIDGNVTIATNTIRALFTVKPMPQQVTSVQFKGWTVPSELSSDTDRPVLPADLSSRVLLPLCREKWATLYKKYTGGNADGIIRSANGAREILRRIGYGQRDKQVRTPIRNV